MTLSQELGRRPELTHIARRSVPASDRVAKKVVHDAELAHAELQFKELASDKAA